MPAPPLANTFEGGSDGTTIAAGNSGGASGDAFQVVQGTPAFSNEQSASGALSMKATGVTPQNVNWTALGALTIDVYLRSYYYIAARPVTDTLRLFRIQTSGGVASGFLGHRPDNGFLYVLNAAGTGTAVGSVETAYNQWIRIECRIRSATSNGQMEWRLYNIAGSATIADTNSSSTMVLGANSDEIKWGNTTGTTAQTFYMDDLAISTDGWIGPSVAGSATILRPAQVT
jgi:hypothetical protein